MKEHNWISPKNWTEDFGYENGNYINTCLYCEQEFLGHKRRVTCKKCYDSAINSTNSNKIDNGR